LNFEKAFLSDFDTQHILGKRYVFVKIEKIALSKLNDKYEIVLSNCKWAMQYQAMDQKI